MLAIVTPAEMAQIDHAAPESTEVLIARAGSEIALQARQMMGGNYGRRVLVTAGKGNNGGDGRFAASVLQRWGVRCRIVAPSEAPDVIAAGNSPTANRFDLVIDAAYGTGLRGPWGAGPAPEVPVLAVDVPSGIDALTGENHGCWPAATTVTFGALKPGLLLHPAAAAVGEVRVAQIGLDISSAGAWLLSDADADVALGHLEPAAHKWRRSVRVIAGSPQMRGAASLVCAAAQQAGAGMVVISSPGVRSGDIARPVEAVARDLRPGNWAVPALEGIERFDVAAVGPGVGTDPTSLAQMAQFVSECPLPLVIDADALTAVATHPECLLARSAVTVLTPHDGEFARLTGVSYVGRDRFDAVRQAAASLNATILLKGPTTLVASPETPVGSTLLDSTLLDSPVVLAVASGTARLATAGSGDVLTGVIAAVLSAGHKPDETATAVAAAAHWHGRTATSPVHDFAAPLTPLTAMRQVELLGPARAHIANNVDNVGSGALPVLPARVQNRPTHD